MVLKGKKFGGGTRGTKQGLINKAHLLKVNKAKKLRKAVETIHKEDTPQTQEPDPIIEEQQEIIEVPTQTKSPKSNKRKTTEDTTQHIPTKITKTESQQKKSPKEKQLPTENERPKTPKQSNTHPNKQQPATNTPNKQQQQQQQQQPATIVSKNKQVQNNNSTHTPSATNNIQKAGDYYILPFKFAKKGSVVRQLLIKPDTINNKLHVANLSMGLDEAALEGIFKFFEPKVAIKREDNVPDATVTCTKPVDMESFFNSLTLPIVLENNNIVSIDNIQGKKPRLHPTEMQKEIDTFMHEYDVGVIENSGKLRAPLEKDADGFRIAARKNNLVREQGSKREKELEALQQKEKAKQLPNFYRFQKEEQFKLEQAEVNKKMVTNKKKIAQMAQQRKFKPF